MSVVLLGLWPQIGLQLEAVQECICVPIVGFHNQMKPYPSGHIGLWMFNVSWGHALA